MSSDMKPLYTVRRVRKDDTKYGPFHGSEDGKETLCGRMMMRKENRDEDQENSIAA